MNTFFVNISFYVSTLSWVEDENDYMEGVGSSVKEKYIRRHFNHSMIDVVMTKLQVLKIKKRHFFANFYIFVYWNLKVLLRT